MKREYNKTWNALKRLNHVSAKPFIVLIKAYQLILSPWLGHHCRFLPTCSNYGLEAFNIHGLIPGLYYCVKRVSKCHPWGGSGIDNIPKSK